MGVALLIGMLCLLQQQISSSYLWQLHYTSLKHEINTLCAAYPVQRQSAVMRPLVSLIGAASALLLLPAVLCNLRVRRVVGGEVAPVPQEDDPVVFVYKDEHDARVYGKREEPGGYYSFKGIRFAEAPVGRFRFQVKLKVLLMWFYAQIHRSQLVRTW